MSHYCEKCGRTMDDNQFYTSKNIEKYPPDGKMRQCKKCMTMFVDNWDPKTYLWILEEVDVPYIKDEWDRLLEKYGSGADAKKITGMTILGKYLSKMKLKQFCTYHWADTERLEAEATQKKILLMQQQGFTGEEIDEQLATDHTPARPAGAPAPQSQDTSSVGSLEIPDDDSAIMDSLTEEDKLYLRLKWGAGYRADQWVHMEQLYNDMMNSYDIQGAGQKDTLIMICKASLRANESIDVGDIEGFQKASKVYDSLMKSAKLTAAQNKENSNDVVDSIGELVALCERDGFIPRYHVDEPMDKVDRVLQDMQKYTRDLVVEELGLGNLIENSIKMMEREQASIQAAAENAEDIEEREEEDLFDYNNAPLEDQDFIDFQEAEDEWGDEE